MGERDEAARQAEAPRERDFTLGAAILRIGARLDLDTVLSEVAESARALTGATHGVIATVDEAGQPPGSPGGEVNGEASGSVTGRGAPACGIRGRAR